MTGIDAEIANVHLAIIAQCNKDILQYRKIIGRLAIHWLLTYIIVCKV